MQNKVNYIFSIFRKIYQLHDLFPDIAYGENNYAKIKIIPGNIEPLLEDKQVQIDPEMIVWKSWKGKNIPFIFNSHEKDIFTRAGDQWIINLDIIGSAFFLLSGWQDFHSSVRNRKGNFPYTASVQCQLDIIHIPVVNYYFDILKTVIEEAYEIHIKPFRWGESDFATFLSHDIDTCETAWMQGGYHAARHLNFGSLFSLLWKKIRGKDAWFNFDEILEMEKEFHATSTFYFIGRKGKSQGIKNADYKVTKPKFQKVFGSIMRAGSEVGLHGSAGTHQNEVRFKEDLERFPAVVKSNRFHFLLYDPVKSTEILDHSALLYDSSIGFPEAYGFRSSFCFPYHPYDIRNDQPFGYYEIPLMLMDGTLQRHLPLNPKESIKCTKQLIDEVKQFGGCLSILWHNTHLSDVKFMGWKDAYYCVLESCVSENGWLSSGEKIIKKYLEV